MGYAKAADYPPISPWGRYPSGKTHKALDLLAPFGSRVQNGMAGTVTTAGWSSTGFGLHVRVKFDDGNTSIYAHLSKIVVKVGQRVAKRQTLGYSGSTGNSTGPHLHWEVRGSSWNPLTSWNFTSKIEPYKAPVVAPPSTSSGSTSTRFNRALLKPGLNNSEVKRFQQWLWSKQGPSYKETFRNTVYNFDKYGYTTNYGPATSKMVQDTYRALNKAYPNGGWNQGWVNGVPPTSPGPGFFTHFGASSY